MLLDLWKELYVPCLELCLPKLKPGGLIFADNMLRPEINRPQALAYRRAVRTKPELTTVLLPIGQGVEVSRLAGPDDAGVRNLEREAVGLPIDDDGRLSTPDRLDPDHPYALTENALRQELGVPLRASYKP